MAHRQGMHRQWVTQVHLDRSRDHLLHLILQDDILFAQSHRGTVHAMDAETGSTLWVRQVGHPEYPKGRLAANDRYVATVNGSVVYLMDRASGEPVWEKSLKKAAGLAMAIGEDRLYVPLLQGMVESYPLWEADKYRTEPRGPNPTYYQSAGTLRQRPLVTPDSLAWVTTRGYVYATDPVELKVRFRFESNGEIDAPMSYRKPNILVSSRDGYVYAVDEKSGHPNWRFSAGNPVSTQPVSIGDGIYVAVQDGGLFKLSPETGREVWWASGVTRFIAASKGQVYAEDITGRIAVLDLKSGTRLGTLPTSGLDIKMLNDQNDRLYLATKGGLLQCLRESQLEEPVEHNAPPSEGQEGDSESSPSDAQPGDPGATPSTQPMPAGDSNPFESNTTPATPAADTDEDPFG
jgi:outer membrane protein assembly factor BamB